MTARTPLDDLALAATYAVAFTTAALVSAAVIGWAAWTALKRGVCK